MVEPDYWHLFDAELLACEQTAVAFDYYVVFADDADWVIHAEVADAGADLFYLLRRVDLSVIFIWREVLSGHIFEFELYIFHFIVLVLSNC